LLRHAVSGQTFPSVSFLRCRCVSVKCVERVLSPRPCSVCGSPRLCRRRERCLIMARFGRGRWRGERFGRYRCLTLRYSLLLSVWVDPSAEHSLLSQKLTFLHGAQARYDSFCISLFLLYVLEILSFVMQPGEYKTTAPPASG